jgi:hypothetical protein
MEDLTGGIELYIPPVIKLSDPNPKLIILTLILIYGGRQGQHKYLDETQKYRIEHIY